MYSLGYCISCQRSTKGGYIIYPVSVLCLLDFSISNSLSYIRF